MKALNWSVMSDAIIRPAQLQDCADVLRLMQALAAFEGYLAEFVVTEADLTRLCFNEQRFGILVAELDGKIEAMLVYYFQPFTYDLSPWLIVKELFVSANCRGLSLGRQLMMAAATICAEKGGKKMKWEVLTHNVKARRFYQRLGATLAVDWRIMTLKVDCSSGPGKHN